MTPEFSGVERRLEKLKTCLSDIEALIKEKSKDEVAKNSNLRAIAERNLEIAAQCCIDIANRIISIEDVEKPQDYFTAIIRLGEARIVPVEFAKNFASIAGFRNVLVHEYADLDWNKVYQWIERLNDFKEFLNYIRKYLDKQS